MLESTGSESADTASSPTAADVGTRHVTLVTDDDALAGRLQQELNPDITLACLALSAIGAGDPLQPAVAGTLLVDLLARPAHAVAAIDRFRHAAAAHRTVIALCDPAQGAAPARLALHHGADDFCQRDASGWELRLRIARLAALVPSVPDTVRLAVGDLELDPRTRTAYCRGQRLRLSARQFDLLRVLMRHPGEVLSQARLLDELSLPGLKRASNVIEVHIHHLRRQVGAERLSTVRGLGYVLHAAS